MLCRKSAAGLRSLLLFLCWMTCAAVYAQSGQEESILYINSYPQGARVCINDNYCGLTPYQAVNIGTNVSVKVQLGDKVREQLIGKFRGRYEVYFVMDGDYGLLNISTNIDSATVMIDGEKAGTAPLKDYRISLGRHLLTVKRDNYETVEKELFIKPAVHDYAIKMQYYYSYVTVHDNTVSDMLIDELSAKKQGSFEYKVPQGKHAVDLIAAGYSGRIRDNLSFEAMKHYDINVRYGYFTPVYALYSAAVPGLGQFLDHSKIKGGIYFTTFAAGSLLYFLADRNYKDTEAGYRQLSSEYYVTTSEAQIMFLRGELEKDISDMNRSAKLKNLFLGAAAGIYIINVIDALIFHSRGSEISMSSRDEGPAFRIRLD